MSSGLRTDSFTERNPKESISLALTVLVVLKIYTYVAYLCGTVLTPARLERDLDELVLCDVLAEPEPGERLLHHLLRRDRPRHRDRQRWVRHLQAPRPNLNIGSMALGVSR